MDLEIGAECRILGTKWDGSAHFAMSGRLLARADGGSWLGMAAGWSMERATRILTIPYACLFHVPDRAAYLARFAAPGSEAGAPVYVDITTTPVWDGATVRIVDLDLDVVRDRQGRVQVVDEDEFAANARRLSYPAEIVADARRSAAEALDLINNGVGPFGAHRVDELIVGLGAQ